MAETSAKSRRDREWMNRAGQWPSATGTQRERALTLLRSGGVGDSVKRDAIVALLGEDSDGSLSIEQRSSLIGVVEKIASSMDAQVLARLAMLGNTG